MYMVEANVLDKYSFFKKLSHWKKLPDDVKIILFYRCLTLLIISFFYLSTQAGHALGLRTFVVASIGVSSVVSSYLYLKSRGNKSKIILLLLAETIGNSFILVPSGGIGSPYVWYLLNTILVASIELDIQYCWLNLSIYIIVSTLASHFLSGGGENSILSILNKEANVILSLVLITFAIQLLSIYMKRLRNAADKFRKLNTQLLSANQKIKESMNYTMELYKAVHLFSSLDSREDLTDIIVSFAQKITRKNKVKFCSFPDCENRISVPDQDDGTVAEIVKTSYKTYGVLYVEAGPGDKSAGAQEVKEQLKFVAELGAIVLERFELEKVNERLLISEEQNRIANEIHDSVLQKLFSISCGLFEIIRSQGRTSDAGWIKQLDTIRGYINDTIKDIRSTVYGLSWKKKGADSFIGNISNYIDEIKSLHKINIVFKTAGDFEMLSNTQKKALYRIICEGIGNAVRHGRASAIDVSLTAENSRTLLSIRDNGTGFELGEVRQSGKMGLGIKNIYELVRMFSGKVDLSSSAGKGTGIDIIMPSRGSLICKEDAV